MYGIVLLAAMTAGGDSPDCFFGRGSCGCYGGGYGGCYGGCYGGYGGCYGGGYGGCYGGCYGGYGGYSGASYGLGYGGWGLPYAGYGPAYTSATTGGMVRNTPAEEDRKGGDRAKVIIELPDDAKLFVDGKPIPGASQKKNFRTPALQKGQEYYYELRAEVMRDGKPVSETRRVVVRAGGVSRADFSSLGGATGVASAK